MDELEYRGFFIGPKQNRKDARNPISGHEWTEATETSILHISASQRRPLLVQLQSGLRSIESAKREVDAAISLSYLSEVERIRVGAEPHGAPHFHAYWSKVVELTAAAGLERPNDDILCEAEPEIMMAEKAIFERPRG